MERLTTRNSEGVAVFKQSYDCEVCGEAIYRLPDLGNGSPTSRLAEYEELEEQGLLLRPKCRLGDVVYALWSIPTESKYVVYLAEVKEINLSSTNARKMIMYKLEPISFRGRYNKYYDDDFGKLVFMSLEEAEQALKERKERKG